MWRNIMRAQILTLIFTLFYTTAYAQGGTWTTKTPMPTARRGLTSSVVNGKIYVFGGEDTAFVVISTVEEYDPATDTWTTKTNMPTARSKLTSSAVNDKIYVIGGLDNINSFSTVEEYDPATDSWTSKANMPTERDELTSSVVNGKIYVLDDETDSVEVYDPASDTWTVKSGMPTRRDQLTSSVVNGKIYAIGGVDSLSNGSSAVEEYDPATDTWTTKTNMPMARPKLTSSVVNGKIYVFSSQAVEVYDPETDTWADSLNPMLTPREEITSSEVDGKIYVIGGESVGGGNHSNVNEEYTPPSVTSIEDHNVSNLQFTLYQNYPNPFNPTTTIQYSLSKKTKVILKVYNLFGQEIMTFINGDQGAGNKSLVWNGKDNKGNIVSSGIYFYRLQVGNKIQSKKMLFLK